MEDKQQPSHLFIDGLDTELYARRDKIRADIDEASQKTAIDNFEIIRQILQISKDPEKLKKLAKGLAFVSTLLPELNELDKKIEVIDYSRKNPAWFEMAMKVSDNAFEREFIELTRSNETGNKK